MRRALAPCVVLLALAVPPSARAATEPFAFAGRTETEVCLGIQASERCVVLTPAEGTPWHLPPADRYVSIAFTITAEPFPGGVADVTAVLQRSVDGSWQSQWANGHVALTGGTELTASWDLSGYPDGSELRLAVFAGSDRALASSVFLYTGFARSFAAQGTLVTG